MTLKLKGPNDVLDYVFPWSTWLSTGETILTSTITVPAGLTMDSESHTDTTATVWLSGGTLGQSYEVVNRITTNQLRTVEKTMQVVIHKR